MARRIIAICDPDLDYAVRVANAANRAEGRRNVEVVAFGDPKALWEYGSQERPSLVAVHELWKHSVNEAIALAPVVWLSESKSALRSAEAVVFKYQAVPELIDALCKAGGIEDLSSGEGAGRKSVSVAVWSAGGGTGKSTLTALLAEEWLRSAGGGVFCLSLEAGASVSTWLQDEGRHDMSAWLYELKSGRQDRLKNALDGAAWRRVEHFGSDGLLRETAQMAKQDASALIRFLTGHEGCRAVFIDCDHGWSGRNEAAWEECDFIVCITNDEPVCSAKTNKWLREWPGWQETGVYRRKAVFVNNKVLPGAALREPRSGYDLPYIPEWKQSADRSVHRYPSYHQILRQLVLRFGGGRGGV
ncbi:hypothetical protein [Paenibacillus thermotolerans]|uniref:hypothetical protein n=1 Tax=Paenibacillus thermotolerans TaxID=3027807 RepID=UPI00236844A7|nr:MULTISPECIES: hypothetical protein [unclassified Paenibacillus]